MMVLLVPFGLYHFASFKKKLILWTLLTILCRVTLWFSETESYSFQTE
jgi:hypothetical protein